MKKFFAILFAVTGITAGLSAEDFVPALFHNGKPIAGFSAVEGNAVNLNPNYGQWAGVLVPFQRGPGKYTITLEILSPGGEQAAATFYLVMADGKHISVTGALQGGNEPKKITITRELAQGVKGLMLKKITKKKLPSVAFRNLRVNYISSEAPAAEDAVQGKKFEFPAAEHKSSIQFTVSANGKTGTALPAKNSQYSWNTIYLGKTYPAGKYLLEAELIVPVEKAASIGLYIAGGKTKGQKMIGGVQHGPKVEVRTVKISFNAAGSFSQLVLKKMVKSPAESVGIGNFSLTVQ